MKYIKDYKDGERFSDVYLCKHKQSAMTKNGKEYINVILQDKTGIIDAKIWDPDSMGIEDFDKFDYVDVSGDVSSFQGALQMSIKRARKCREGEYVAADYLPVSKKDIEVMYGELLKYMESVENVYYKKLLHEIFVADEEFVKKFKYSSAAKSVHHGFVGGLVEHTLAVTNICAFIAKQYSNINRDLLLTASICHDIAKVVELSPFPMNDYTDEGQLLGHIVMGAEMVSDKAKEIPDFPRDLLNQLKHCILAHHGKMEYGSPKVPALMEACALHFADNTDAKMQTFTELLESTDDNGWLGYQRMLETNVRRSIIY